MPKKSKILCEECEERDSRHLWKSRNLCTPCWREADDKIKAPEEIKKIVVKVPPPKPPPTSEEKLIFAIDRQTYAVLDLQRSVDAMRETNEEYSQAKDDHAAALTSVNESLDGFVEKLSSLTEVVAALTTNMDKLFELAEGRKEEE